MTFMRQIALIAAIVYLFAAGQARADGTDPTAVSGQAGFSTQGGTPSITNSPWAMIHWQGYSIDASENTRLIQQSADPIVRNRVIRADHPSVILGEILVLSGEVGIYGALLRNAGILDADQVEVQDASGKIVLRVGKQDGRILNIEY